MRAFAVIALVGCYGSTSPAPSLPVGPAAVVPTPEPTPLARATKLATAQVQALRLPRSYDLRATFDKGAVVLARNAIELVDQLPDVIGGSPHDSIDHVELTHVVASGNAAVVWLMAEVELTIGSHEEGMTEPMSSTATLYATELIVADVKWTAVAAAFATFDTGYAPLTPVPHATEAGPLAALLGSPAALDRALSNDPSVVVVDTREVAVGPAAAHALVAKLPALAIVGDVREVRTTDWGFVQANAMRAGVEVTAQLLALPDSAGGWSVVAVHLVTR